jgi:hypothetical protein
MRVSEKMLESLCDTINKVKNTPEKAYDRIEGKFKANIGNYHLYFAYGSVGLHKMVNEGGGVSEVIGLSTKKDLYYQLHAFLKGARND